MIRNVINVQYKQVKQLQQNNLWMLQEESKVDAYTFSHYCQLVICMKNEGLANSLSVL